MKEDFNLYEIGFHFSPDLTEEEVGAKVSSIKEAVTKNGGSFVSEESPKMIPLAYTIEVHSDSGNKRYNKAYFGWVKFDMEPENVSKISEFAKADKSIIRFILVKTDKGNTVVFHKAPIQAKKDEESEESELELKEEKEETEEPRASEEEIDKTIDELVV